MIAGWALAALCLAAGDAHPSAVESLAETLSTQIVSAHPEPPLALAFSGPASDAVLSLVAARLAGARFAPAPLTCASDCDERALASGARTVVRLTLREDASGLSADGELHGVWRNFWAGKRDVRPPGPAAALHAQVTSAPNATGPAPDAGTGAPPLASGTLQLVAQDLTTIPEAVEALAAADLDGDGTDEVLALTAHALLTFDASGTPLAQHPLAAIPRASVSSRDPIGTLGVQPSPLAVFAFSQTRAAGERLSWDGARRSWVTSAALQAPRLGCSGELFAVSFTPGENTFEPVRPPVPFAPVPQRTSALACRLTPSGGLLLQVAPDGSAKLQSPSGTRALTGIGAGAAWVDVDGDGMPELASSSAQLDPQPDTLTITPLKAPRAAPAGIPPQTLALPGRILHITALRVAGRMGEAMVVARAEPDGTTVLTRVEEALR